MGNIPEEYVPQNKDVGGLVSSPSSVLLAEWLRKLSRLKVDRAKGNPAPHKPLLLLVVIDLAEEGALPSAVLQLTPELAFRFFTYWGVVSQRRTQRPDIRLPFHHLSSDGVWTPLTADGSPSPDRRLTRAVKFDQQFRALLDDADFRRQARQVLIRVYFQPNEQLGLCAMIGIPADSILLGELGLDLSSASKAETKGREARFRLTVVSAYNYTCALTRYRLTTISAGSIVDAAHIHQFASSNDNSPQNGIALCKNAHWLFDCGLWTLTDDFRVLVANAQFTESCPDQKGLRDYEGVMIMLPAERGYWPSSEYLAWHRRHKFQG